MKNADYHYVDYEKKVEERMLEEFGNRSDDVKKYLSSGEAKEIMKNEWDYYTKKEEPVSVGHIASVAYSNLRMLF